MALYQYLVVSVQALNTRHVLYNNAFY